MTLSLNSHRVGAQHRTARYAVCAALLAGLTACSGSAGGTITSTSPATRSTTSGAVSSSRPSTSATAPTTAAGRTITVTGSTVTPTPTQVDLAVGETLTLVVTSDHDDELHAHGFEVEEQLKAGKPTTLTLTGKDTGVFEVETHHPALTLLTIAVR